MPYYHGLRKLNKKHRTRTINGLKRIRAQMDALMPRKTRNATIVLGTWNIRNFDDNRFGSGPRTAEDIYYLAEIIDRFDIIAVQEICDDLGSLKYLMRILGGSYSYITTDVTEGPGGNGERLAFIYDRNKVTFKGVAGELVLPDSMQIVDGENKRQFSRTPFMCSFQSGWFKFMFSTVHIYFGTPSGEKYKRRVAEIKQVASFLAKRAKHSDYNHILVGDFNIKEKGSEGYNALTKKRFRAVQNNLGSNKDQTKFYDQISYWERPNELVLADGDRTHGVLQFFDSLYRPEDFSSFKQDIKVTLEQKIARQNAAIEKAQARHDKTGSDKVKATQIKKITKARTAIQGLENMSGDDEQLKHYYLSEWRTFHGSDHLPLWLELKIDFSEPYLDKLLGATA